eukprot:TRINITY_DN46542_c0_g1_i1.p1 TRINITY_DN46542_c0_g1~~TRINITY_DN46542_c0_g1_i1.p1  ORF type:complete len:334 (-),score=32.85 TRINITY_DN46542_c0_g1_i1:325-1257(-)
MEGLCQKHCVHFVPCDVRFPTPSLLAPGESSEGVHPRESRRINVTFRWIRNHKQRCKKHALGLEHLFCDLMVGNGQLQLAPPGRGAFAQDWAEGRPVTWQSCSGCDHDGWRGGRNCVKYGEFWLCRRCLARAKVLGDAILDELPTDQEAAAERKRCKRASLRAAATFAHEEVSQELPNTCFQDAAQLSQARAFPGCSGGGGMSLYDAVFNSGLHHRHPVAAWELNSSVGMACTDPMHGCGISPGFCQPSEASNFLSARDAGVLGPQVADFGSVMAMGNQPSQLCQPPVSYYSNVQQQVGFHAGTNPFQFQ